MGLHLPLLFSLLVVSLQPLHTVAGYDATCSCSHDIPKKCGNIFWELVTLARIKQAYECPKTKEKVTVSEACRAGTCSRLLKQGGSAWTKCKKTGDQWGYQDQVECIVEETLMACGYGMYGAALAGDMNCDLRCPCQLLEAQIERLLEKAKNDKECECWVPKMLCIPNMMSAISICSFPRHDPDPYGARYNLTKCIMRTMKTRVIHDGVSVPVCYIHLCHALQKMYGITMPNCECDGKYTKRNFQGREFFAFENQDPNIHVKLQRYEACAARDVTVHPMPKMKFLQSQVYTDFADPQACNRFQRCWENGPCFNGTDGGYCGKDEHFKVNVENPKENGCYPRAQVDCLDVPLTLDSLGHVPFCFENNKDFSDIWEQKNTTLSLGRVTAFHFGVDGNNYVDSLQFQYEGRWSWWWGAPERSRKRVITLGPNEYIKVISGKTIDIDTVSQRVAEVTIEMLDMDSKSTRSETFGFVPQEVDHECWEMSYPKDANAYNGCPLKFVCGSLLPGKYIQVLTTHWYECCFSTNPFNNGKTQVNAENICK